MDFSENIRARDVLGGRRKKPSFEMPAGICAEIFAPDAEHIREALRHRLATAGNRGFWKRLSAVVLEPVNPFNTKAPRRFRHEAIVFAALLLLAISIVAFFNVAALAR